MLVWWSVLVCIQQHDAYHCICMCSVLVISDLFPPLTNSEQLQRRKPIVSDMLLSLQFRSVKYFLLFYILLWIDNGISICYVILASSLNAVKVSYTGDWLWVVYFIIDIVQLWGKLKARMTTGMVMWLLSVLPMTTDDSVWLLLWCTTWRKSQKSMSYD